MERTAAWQAEIAADGRAKIVIDDDPTGTQAVSDVGVILRPDRAAFDDFLASGRRATFVLSNSRALPEAEAVELVGDIARVAAAAARAAGRSTMVILRGDSTLRGHVFAEVDTIAPRTPLLFVPAFLDGGRFTRDGIHHVSTPAGPVSVADTEFARDPRFGYRSGDLRTWVREVSSGRRHAATISLSRLRQRGPDAVTDALLGADPDTVVVPDCVSDADVMAIAVGLLRAHRRGVPAIVRCAASLAAALTGLSAHRLERVEIEPPGRVLIACGSFTDASTRQLRALDRLWRRRVEITMPAGTDDPDLAGTARLVETLREGLALDQRAVLSTDRVPRHAESPTAPELLMDSLVATVNRLATAVDLVIAKGGITAARLSTEALGAESAEVLGQILPGVPVWRLRTPHGNPSYVVVPGNVGTDATLATILERITTAPGTGSAGTLAPSRGRAAPR